MKGFHLGACRSVGDDDPAGDDCHPDCPRALHAENARLRAALNDIWSASRDEGLARMINSMRATAFDALSGSDNA